MTLAITAVFSLTSAILFFGIYSYYRWWGSAAGWSVATMALSIALLSTGAVMIEVLNHPYGEWVASFAFLTVGLNTVYRTIAMVSVNSKEK